MCRMGVSNVRQGEIVEVSVSLPNGENKVHMVLVVSGQDLIVEESMFYGIMITSNPFHSSFKIEITPDMLTRPLTKQSYFATHLLGMYSLDEVIKSCRIAIKREYMDEVFNKSIDVVYGYEEE